MGDKINRPQDEFNDKKEIEEASTVAEDNTQTERSPSAMSSKEEENKKSPPPTLKSCLLMFFLLVAYIAANILAGYIFQVIERKPNAGTLHWLPAFKEEFLKNNTCIAETDLEAFLEKVQEAIDDDVTSLTGNDSLYKDDWTLPSGFLLSFTIASTIGYGLVTPITPGGQAFCMIYALLSIPFTGLLAAKLGSLMAYFIRKAAHALFRNSKVQHRAKLATVIFTFTFGVFLYVIIPSVLLTFISNEEGWTFVECLYCVFVTLTTIGFGDYVPDPHATGGMGAYIFVLIWVIAGLAWFATIVNLLATMLTKQASTIKRKVVHQQINIKNFTARHLSLKSASTAVMRAKKARSKSTLNSAENGDQVNTSNKSISSTDENDEEIKLNKTNHSVSNVGNDPVLFKTSSIHLSDIKNDDNNPYTSSEPVPATSFMPQIESESTESRRASCTSSSKRGSDVFLAPSGFLSVVINHMEDIPIEEK